MTNTTAATAAPPGISSSMSEDTPYAMQVLMEELATLRKRNKELEDDNRTGMTVETDGTLTNSEAEEAGLRKQLQQVSDAKAAQELEFMNQLSQIAREGAEKEESLMKELEQQQEELNKYRQHANNDKTRFTTNTDHERTIQQLQQDLESADEELKVNRRDVEELYKKNRKLETQKSTLIEEVTQLRVEVDNESKVAVSMQQAMEENDKHIVIKTKKLQEELVQKNAIILKHNQEIGEMNDGVIKLEGQRAMLLDEITDLRMQLDRAEDGRDAMKKKLEEIMEEQREQSRMINSASSGIRVGALMQSVSDAQEKQSELEDQVGELQKELRAVTTAYKKDSAKWEEMSAFKESELEKARADLEEATRVAKKAQLEVLASEDDAAQLRSKLEAERKSVAELEQEVTTLQNQKVSYEKNSSKAIQQHVAQVDEALEHNKVLEAQLEALKSQVSNAKETSSKKLTDSAESSRHSQRTGPPISPPLSPPLSPQPSYRGRNTSLKQRQHSWATSPSSQRESVRSQPDLLKNANSVRAIAAAFEGKGPASPPATKSVVPRGRAGEGPVPTAVVIQAYPAVDVEELQQQLEDLEHEVDQYRAQNELLTQKLREQCELVGELQAEVTTLSASKTAIQQLSRKEFAKESEESESKIAELEDELEQNRQELMNHKDQVDKLKCEIRAMTCERLAYEECTMEAYEKRAVTSQKSYQGEVNQVKVELTNAQVRIANMEKDYQLQIEKLEASVEELNAECDAELEAKQGELDVIKYRLDEQRDMVDKLTKEREQLCLQMNELSNARRDEIAELQSDLMEKTTQNTSLARAMQALQMQVEHHEGNTREVEFLQERVKELETKPNGNGGVFKNQVELETLSDETKKLRDMVRNLTIERRGLQEKLNAVVRDKKENRSNQVLRERNEKLRREVDRLTKKISKIEGSVTRIAI